MKARGLSLLLAVVFALAMATSLTFPPRARVYPLWVAVAGGVLALVALIRAQGDEQLEGPAVSEIVRYLAWVAGLLVTAGLLGLPTAAVLFAGAFLRLEARTPLRGALVGAAATGVGLLVVGAALSLRWPVAVFDVTRALGLS